MSPRRMLPFAALALLASCAVVEVEARPAADLPALRAAGLRVAVMPFVVSADEDGFLGETLAPIGELISLEANRGRPLRDAIGDLVHGDVVAWLQQGDFEVVDPWHVATQLTHAAVPTAHWRNPAHAATVARACGADAVLYGDLRRWNRNYYVVETIVEVALALRLVEGATGRELFAGLRRETLDAGLSGGPTGYSSAATTPIAGLRGSQLRTLTRDVARHAVADLNGGELGGTPGPTSPRLSIVALAKAHDGPFRAGERVDVVAIGTPDCAVRFELGRLRTAVPMRQTERHEDARGVQATYVGHYIVGPADAADDLPLACTIERGLARRVVTARYRWEGAVALRGRSDDARR